MIRDNSALIVIDIQKQFVGDLPEEMKASEVVNNACRVIEKFRQEKKNIIFFREVHRKNIVDFGRELDGDEKIHCIEGTEAADYVDEIVPQDNGHEYEMTKRRYSCFFATDLNILLKGLKVENLYVIGLLSDVCVHYTSADAHQHDYHLRVVKEACGGSSVKAHLAAMDAIEYLQHGSVISVEDL
ncbi:MAG: cysteine hydrolase [Treponema sp.]|nr:cysteine hydrolase [Candidatus Treponema equi]